MYNHYLAVDDITIDFSSADFSNSDNVAYVQSDEKVTMDEVSIKTVNSQEQFDICYPLDSRFLKTSVWYYLEDSFELKMPKNNKTIINPSGMTIIGNILLI